MKQLSTANLQELVEANLISAEQAKQIETYYQTKLTTASSNRLSFLFGILGSLLVTLGIVLFIAHNWDELNKFTKTFISFLPLFVGQVICFYTLARKKQNPLWHEAAAIVLFFAVPASVSLISQIYNINGAMSDFLLAWLVLTFPLVYILQSTTVVYLLISLATWYACETGYGYQSTIPWLYLVFLLLLFPHYKKSFQTSQRSNAFYLYNWLLVLSFSIVFGSFKNNMSYNFKLTYIGYFALYSFFYSIGKSHWLSDTKWLSNPFLRVSIPALLLILFFWSFDFNWSEYSSLISYIKTSDLFYSPFTYFTLLFLAGSLYFVWKKWAKENQPPDPLYLSLYVFIAALLIGESNLTIALLLLNTWILFIGLWYVRKGNNNNHFGLLNFGLIIIAILAVSRFFDDNIPFIWRGFFFLLTGIGFFVANIQLIRKRKKLV